MSLRLLVAPTAGLLLILVIAVGASAAPPASFGTEGPGAGQISGEPHGVAIARSSGDAYLGDRNNNRVDQFGPEGEFLRAWGSAVADGTTETAQVCTSTCFGANGPPFLGSGPGRFVHPEGVAVDNDTASASHGDVYVLDAGNDRIQKFGAQGQFLLMFGGNVDKTTGANVCTEAGIEAGDVCGAGVEGTGPGEFTALNGRALAVGPGGTVHVGDLGRIQEFSPAGAPLGELAIPGSGFIENLAVDSGGDLYISASGFFGVRKYDPSGTQLGGARDEFGQGGFLSIALGPADELFVNDLQGGRHHLLTFAPGGAQISSFDAAPEAEDAGLHGIAYGETAGAVYLGNPGRVRIVDPPAPGPFILPGTESAGQITTEGATLGAQINPEGSPSVSYRFEYGTTAAYGESTPSTPLPLNELQSLSLEATAGTFTLTFEGEASAPLPFAPSAAEVQGALEALPAIGAGNLAVGGAPGGPYAIEFIGARGAADVGELSADATNLVNGEAAGTATVTTTSQGHPAFADREVAAAITGLQTRTVYHYRVLATNAAAETSLGPDQTFETLPPVSIDSTSSSKVTSTEATLEAELNPHGLASTYHFEYGLDTSYGTDFPVPDGSAGSGGADVGRSALVQGLQPLTTYHFRVVAANALGGVVGPDRSFTTQGPSSPLLPDGRVWEMVSPPDKHGSPLEPLTEEGGLIEASKNGDRLAYVALGPITDDPAGVRSPHDTQLLASRGAEGWGTEEISTPHEEVSKIHPSVPSEYKFAAEDLDATVVEPEGVTKLSPRTDERTPYRREADGEYVPLVTAANVPEGIHFGGEELENTNGKSGAWGNGIQFVTATPDLAHQLIKSPQALAPGFGPGFVPNGQPNFYELTDGKLQLVSILPSEEPVAEAGLSSGIGNNELNLRGALSDDGRRVDFSAAGHLYQRDLALGKTLQLDQVQPGAVGGGSEAVFQGADSNGSRVFFSDESRLTPDATAKVGKPDLYMCEVGESAGRPTCALSDISVDPAAGEAADVRGEVLGVDDSGSHVYFAADGVLTGEPNKEGARAVPGDCASEEAAATCNLYLYEADSKKISLVAVLSAGDKVDWGEGTIHNLGNLTARVSPGGRYLAFMSQRSLTGYDNRDLSSGEPDAEVFLFDSETAALDCVSCNPTGARPRGVLDDVPFPGLLVDHPHSWRRHSLAATLPGWTLVPNFNLALYQSRYLSDSGRLFFDAADPLVPQDTNGVMDVYEYEPPGVGDCTEASPTFGAASGGCVALISSGTSSEESAFLDASENGDDVFFLTAARLSGFDTDGALDIYDASVGGTNHEPIAPIECAGDACQQPAVAPAHTTPGTLLQNGPGNVTQCPRGKFKKGGRCVKKHGKKKNHKGHKKATKHKKKNGRTKKQKRAAGRRRGDRR